MEDLAEKYLNDHKNPVIKTELFGSKLLVSALTENEKQQQETCFSKTEQVLKHDRVERRLARSVAEWLPKQNVARVTKIVGSTMATFGYQNKNGKFLTPEESLFLLETNKLELTFDTVPLSIEEGFKIIANYDLGKYLAYKKLALQGYKLKPYRKQDSEDVEEPPKKVAKVEEPSKSESNMSELFEKLQEVGPKQYKKTGYVHADYVVSSPSSSASGAEDFNLIIKNDKYFDSVDIEDHSNIYAINCDSEISFYKFSSCSVPNWF